MNQMYNAGQLAGHYLIFGVIIIFFALVKLVIGVFSPRGHDDG